MQDSLIPKIVLNQRSSLSLFSFLFLQINGFSQISKIISSSRFSPALSLFCHINSLQSVIQLLTECTKQLGLTRAASKVYTKDGTTILSLCDLVLWALEASFIQRDTEKQTKEAVPVQTKETTIKRMKGWLQSVRFS